MNILEQGNEWKRYYRKNRFLAYYNAVMVKTKINRPLSLTFSRERITNEETQKLIIESIDNSKPIMVSRFGCTESRCLGESYGIQYGCLKKYRLHTLNTINNYSGVFPYGPKGGVEQFFELTNSAIRDIDLLGVWTTEMQDYLVNTKCRPDVKITNLDNLEPYRTNKPWTQALKGKKVLVVHPFKETIESQYKKRDKLFDNPNILPEFDLRVIQAVQTIAGQLDPRFRQWKQALDYMYDECTKKEFDVAIIGCGAYGMPLASLLKRYRKIAIHLGGATQILFGIKGRRWDNNTSISLLFNDYWVRPMASETPHDAFEVENGCYW